jgi:DeoR/GlpR family transcriptional regulator of sugar metabolism
MNTIIVEHGSKKKLQKIFNVSHVTVRKALNGEKDTDLAKRIRKAALQNGGKEVVIITNENTIRL